MKMLLSCLLFLLTAWPACAQQQVSIGPSDIGGVVTGSSGPEAGVWVSAAGGS
jgi:hypothetical protein